MQVNTIQHNSDDEKVLRAVKVGRPRNFKRKTSIDGAMNLFWEKGINAVTAQLLAEKMGIQRSSFYSTFGTKEAVFKESLLMYEDISPDRWLFVIKPGDPVLPQLKGYFRELCLTRSQDTLHRGCLFSNSVTELSGQANELGQLLETLMLERIALMQTLFQQAQNQNEITRICDIDALARGFIVFVLGINTMSKIVTDEDQLLNACNIYLDGILASE